MRLSTSEKVKYYLWYVSVKGLPLYIPEFLLDKCITWVVCILHICHMYIPVFIVHGPSIVKWTTHAAMCTLYIALPATQASMHYAPFITPCACARDKLIGLFVIVGMKIARSQGLVI